MRPAALLLTLAYAAASMNVCPVAAPPAEAPCGDHGCGCTADAIQAGACCCDPKLGKPETKGLDAGAARNCLGGGKVAASSVALKLAPHVPSEAPPVPAAPPLESPPSVEIPPLSPPLPSPPDKVPL
jgi:hypothetical protein